MASTTVTSAVTSSYLRTQPRTLEGPIRLRDVVTNIRSSWREVSDAHFT